MTSAVLAVATVLAVVLALALAFVPMRLAIGFMSKRIAEPIRAFIARQRERRALNRGTPDRRHSG